MLKLRRTGLFACLILAQSVFAQAPQIDTDDVARVGSHIACQCGGCKESLTCPMAKRGCGFCNPAKMRIAKLQQAGMSDTAIIDLYKKEFGEKVYLTDPSPFFWIVPTLVIALGVFGIYFFVRRYARPIPALVSAPDLDPKYRERIERETANLE